MVERNQPAQDRLLPDRETDAVPVLEREGGLLVGEAEFIRFRPELDDLIRRDAGPRPVDGNVEVVATALVGIDLRGRSAPNRERPVVTGAVAVEAVDDVEVSRITGAEDAIREVVWVWAATLTGDGVDALDEF